MRDELERIGLTQKQSEAVINLVDDRIAKKLDEAVTLVEQRITSHFYERIGSEVVSRGLTLLGIGALALFAYLQAKGLFR